MIVVCVSDTHLQHKFDVPPGDLILHSGDATWRGTSEEILKFAEWYGALPHASKVFVAGNHDWGFQNGEAELCRAILADHGITYLQDSGVEIGGLKIWGSPWQPEFCNWAFNLSRVEGELAERWALIPDDTNVLITHGPPKGILDRTNGMYHEPENVGCWDLRARIKSLKALKAHVFGHVHPGYGVEGVDGVMHVNASVCDESYRPVNKPVVLDLGAPL